MSSALWGTVLGALLGNIPTERYGRKPTLVGIGVLYFVSALGSAVAPDPYTFFAPRVFELAGLDAGSALLFSAGIGLVNLCAKGQSLGSGTHWVFAALITLLMPSVLSAFHGSAIFAFFAAMMVLQLLFVLFLMPETKGRSLESLAEGLSRNAHASFDVSGSGNDR